MNAKEIEVFFGIQMTMAIVKMPQCKMFWSPEFRYERVFMAMALKRYETLRNFLHVNDNDSRNNPENSNDKLFKVRPLLDLVRNNCIKTEPEKSHSIDEQITPTKTKFSGGVKQYSPKKVRKWGFKNMVRVGQSGIVYDFFVYGRKSILRLGEEIPKNQNYRVLFDNWFSTLPLLIKLQSMGILSTTTLRSNSIAGCPLTSDKDFKARGRGSFDYHIDLN